MRDRQRQAADRLTGQLVEVELEVAGADAEERVVGHQPAGRAPGVEARGDVLVRDVLLERQRPLEALRVALDDQDHAHRCDRAGRERELPAPPVGQHEEDEAGSESDQRAAREAEHDRRRDETDRAQHEGPQQLRPVEHDEHQRQRGGEHEGEVVLVHVGQRRQVLLLRQVLVEAEVGGDRAGDDQRPSDPALQDAVVAVLRDDQVDEREARVARGGHHRCRGVVGLQRGHEGQREDPEHDRLPALEHERAPLADERECEAGDAEAAGHLGDAEPAPCGRGERAFDRRRGDDEHDREVGAGEDDEHHRPGEDKERHHGGGPDRAKDQDGRRRREPEQA